MTYRYGVNIGEIFLFLFVMLGPVKVIAPFYAYTRQIDPSERRRVAIKVAILSTTSVLIAGYVGSYLLGNWNVPAPVMQFAGGLTFLLVALKAVMSQYDDELTSPPRPNSGMMRMVFPVNVTPFGIAALIVFIALSQDLERSMMIGAVALAMMLLNGMTMYFIDGIFKVVAPTPLQIIGAVLGMLQVALALRFIFESMPKLIPLYIHS